MLASQHVDIEIGGGAERKSNKIVAGVGRALFIDDQYFESLIAKVWAAANFTIARPGAPTQSEKIGNVAAGLTAQR